MEMIRDMIVRVMIFLLLANVIGNLLERSKYSQHFSYITGLIVIVMVLSPVIRLVRGQDIFSFEFNRELYSQDRQEVMREIEATSRESQKLVWKQFEEKVAAWVEESCEKENVTCQARVIMSEEGELDRIVLMVANEQVIPSGLVS